MKKVLVISEIFHPQGGGAELATYLILKFLRDEKFKITVVTGTRNPTIINKVKYYHTRLLGNWNRIRRFLLMGLLANKNWFKKMLKQHNVLYVPLLAYPLIPIAKEHGLRVIVHLHNYVPVRYYGIKYFFEPQEMNIWKELRYSVFHEVYEHKNIIRTFFIPYSYLLYKKSKKWLELADTIICVSVRQAEIIKKLIPNISKKIKVIYNPIPNIKINIKNIKKSKIPMLVYSGGESYAKGFYILMEALPVILSLNKDLKLILTGRYSIKTQHILKKISFKTNGRIKLLGYLPYTDLIRIKRAAWGFLFPSIWEEPLPYSVVESMLVGTIPLASKIGGLSEIINKTPAAYFLYSPGNVNQMISQINDLLKIDRRDLEDIGYKLREFTLLKFNNEDIRENIIKVFM